MTEQEPWVPHGEYWDDDFRSDDDWWRDDGWTHQAKKPSEGGSIADTNHRSKPYAWDASFFYHNNQFLVWLFGIAAFLVLIFVYWWLHWWLCRNFRRRDQRRLTFSTTATIRSIEPRVAPLGQSPRRPRATDINDASDTAAAVGSKIAEMDIEERIILYENTFDRSDCQIVLNASHFRSAPAPCQGSCHSAGGSSDDDSTGSSRSSCVPGKTDKNSHSMVHPGIICRNIFSGDDENSPREPKTQRANATCVICLEGFQPGDTVVWSETGACPHVFRKDCLVSFFAHKKKTVQDIEMAENPCPVCRQKFVTIRPMDIESYMAYRTAFQGM